MDVDIASSSNAIIRFDCLLQVILDLEARRFVVWTLEWKWLAKRHDTNASQLKSRTVLQASLGKAS